MIVGLKLNFTALLLILLFLTLTACTHTLTPVCRHNAMYAALTACETMPVRLARGEVNSATHVEAQVFHDNRWWYVDNKTLALSIQPNAVFTIQEYWSVPAYFDHYFAPFFERFSSENK